MRSSLLERPTLGRAFFRFYSAIFKLTSAKFQSFADNSRAARSSYIKFDSSLRLMSCMLAPNFEANSHVTSVLGPQILPESLA